MPIEDMIANARTAARENNQKIHPYWGEYLSVMKLIAAYYGDFNVGNLDNFNEIKPVPLDQTLALYRVIHAALDTECADESATILSQAMRDLALHYKRNTGVTIGVALGWAA